MKRWRRLLILIALLLLGGAVVNVAVAWAIAARMQYPQAFQRKEVDAWSARVPAGWPAPVVRLRQRGPGWSLTVEGTDPDLGTPGWMRVKSSDHQALSLFEYGFPRRAIRLATWTRYNSRSISDLDEGGLLAGLDRTKLVKAGLFSASDGRIPVDPLGAGCLINTLFYTAILALPLSFFPLRRRLRARRGRCPKCGYDLAGLAGAEKGAEAAAPCPECGSGRMKAEG